MNNWKIIFAAGVIFGAGVLTGSLSVNCLQHCGYHAPKLETNAVVPQPVTNSPVRPEPPRVLSKQFLQSLDENLHLTPPQREKIDKIICDGQNLMRKTLQDARLEIRDALAPEQRNGFDDLMKRQFQKPIFGSNAPAMVVLTNPPASK